MERMNNPMAMVWVCRRTAGGLAVAAWLAVAAVAVGETRWQEMLDLAHVWDVGPESALFVVGAAEELGAWDAARGVRLTWTEGNAWTGRVAVSAGREHEYKFVRRSMSPSAFCDAANAEWMPGDNLRRTAPPAPAPPFAGKSVFYLSAWSNVHLVHRLADGTWTGALMAVAGPGRGGAEKLHSIHGVGVNDRTLEFVFNGTYEGASEWDNAPVEGPVEGSWNYHCALDALWVQDKQVFGYRPAPQVGPPRIEERQVGSSVDGIPGRTLRIYLPRGYDQHAERRYPVLYMHDGQELFCGDSPRDDQWNADWHATREIGQGRARECILVGIDNNSANRQAEYEPPGDRYYDGYPSGIADLYLRFFADNVRPTLDWNYRTRTGPQDTFVGGSSMGGLVSIYFGYETNVFGGVLAMSPAITRAPNYAAALWGRARRELRIYLDTGNNEGSVGPGGGDYWYKPWEAYAIFLRQGYAVNRDLLMRVGCGAVHNEAAWSARFSEAFRFLLDARREPNSLAFLAHPPSLESGGLDEAGKPVWHAATLHGHRCELARAPDLLRTEGWTHRLLSTPAETNPWGRVSWTGDLPGGFYRLAVWPEP
jgi:predicted alpha/beta superfamily hydrolase